MVPFALCHDVVIECAEGIELVGIEVELLGVGCPVQGVGIIQELAHLLRPWLVGGFLHMQQFAQQVRVAQGMGTGIELPVRCQAVVDQYAGALGEDAVIDDGGHAALLMHTVPGEGIVGDNVQPMQLAGHPQARLIGMGHRGSCSGGIEASPGVGNVRMNWMNPHATIR